MQTRAAQVSTLKKLLKNGRLSLVLEDLAHICEEFAIEAQTKKDLFCEEFWRWQASCCAESSHLALLSEERTSRASALTHQSPNT